VPLPKMPTTSGESWLTVRAVLADDQPWAPAGHEVAWGQLQVRPSPGVILHHFKGARARGEARFDPVTGRLTRLGDIALDGPRLDLWRAPTDNDDGLHGPIAPVWRAAGLHRLRHRLVDVTGDIADELVVRTRVAPAGHDRGMLATYRWTADGEALRLTVEVEPQGQWDFPLPRLGVRLAVPASFGNAEWFGPGPGESYRDTNQAARVGRFAMTVDEMQTPYVFSQENGHRGDVRWARLTDGAGAGIRFEGDPVFGFTARRWTSEDLDAAHHTFDLMPRDAVYVNLDLAQHGIGSASCGPGVLPRHRLAAEPAEFRVVLRPVG
jgi:beta-galactosidase